MKISPAHAMNAASVMAAFCFPSTAVAEWKIVPLGGGGYVPRIDAVGTLFQ